MWRTPSLLAFPDRTPWVAALPFGARGPGPGIGETRGCFPSGWGGGVGVAASALPPSGSPPREEGLREQSRLHRVHLASSLDTSRQPLLPDLEARTPRFGESLLIKNSLGFLISQVQCPLPGLETAPSGPGRFKCGGAHRLLHPKAINFTMKNKNPMLVR